jgi:AcrR family transcriptional regulator
MGYDRHIQPEAPIDVRRSLNQVARANFPAGTTTEQVQSAAGVSASQLYHYFGDKRSLTRAVIQYQIDAILGFQEPLLARLDSLDAIRGWADAFVDAQRSRDFRGGCPLGARWPMSSPNATRRQELTSRRATEGGTKTSELPWWPCGTLANWSESTDVNRLATTLLTTLQGEVADISGKYFSRGKPKRVKTKLNTQANRDRLWDLSMETLR